MMPLIAAIVLALAAPARADSSMTATKTAQFLELPAGARATAMGSAGAASSIDATALYYNPALLCGMKGGSASATYSAYFAGINYQYLAVAQQTPAGVLSLGAQYLRSGAIDEIDNTGAPTGAALSPADMAVSAGYAASAGFVGFGAAAKYIRSRLQNSAATYAFDMGVSADAGKMRFGFSAANIGKGLSYNQETEALPLVLRLGSLYQAEAVSLTADAVLSQNYGAYIAAGAEYAVPVDNTLTGYLRGGYNSRYASSRLGGSIMAGATAGLGLSCDSFSADYSFAPMGDLGSIHRFSVAARWGRGSGGNRFGERKKSKISHSGSVYTLD